MMKMKALSAATIVAMVLVALASTDPRANLTDNKSNKRKEKRKTQLLICVSRLKGDKSCCVVELLLHGVVHSNKFRLSSLMHFPSIS